MKRSQPLFEVRNSPVHGRGVFAMRRIRKGTTVVEYLGDRVSHEEVDERYADKLEDDNHTFLFTVDTRLVIDAGRNGNEARFINHACDPNCESTIRKRRVFIEAIRTIQPGEELCYDYAIGRDADDAPNVDEVFACRCGAENCRGSMLEPRKQPRRASKKGARKKSRRKTFGGKTSRGKTSHRNASARAAASKNKRRAARPRARRGG
jgi:uncharacterized protein